MKYIVIKKETTIVTRVFEVDVEPGGPPGYPTPQDRAVSATSRLEPVGIDTIRRVRFDVLKSTQEVKDANTNQGAQQGPDPPDTH